MKITLELISVLLIFCFERSKSQSTFFNVIRDVYAQVLMPPSQISQNLRLADEKHKLQPKVHDDIPFPCNLSITRSEERPSSVHALRPGDIDVVGAIGDSIFSGNGLIATNILQIGIENRGMSFVMGGQSNWRQFLTLSNILKEFNPNLIGYSTQDSFIHHKESQFNVAVPAMFSRDTVSLTKTLIKRINNNSSVDIANHWKMIFILIGANDFCSRMCYYKNPEVIVENHRKDLTDALRILRDNLPRTIVMVILTPSLRAFTNTTLSNMPSVCYFTRSVFCSCLFGSQFQQNQFDQIMKKWQEIQMEVVNSQEFNREDFTVVAQPFTLNYYLHRTDEGLTDYSDLSADCFHMSQKEAARAAISLWNNIMEPVGKKTTTLGELYTFKCPNNRYPYIFTRRNSLNVKK